MTGTGVDTINARGLIHFVHRWILRTPHIVAELPQYQLELKVSPFDVVGRHLYKYRRYEPEIAAALVQHVRPAAGDIVVDVGANIGWYSLLVSRLTGGACRVLAFEPDPDNFALLQHNLALNGASNVTAFNLAVGESAATLQLHRYGKGNTGRHSLLGLHEGETVPVQVVALDAHWAAERLPLGPIRLLKMDIEGYEVLALRGARATLGRCQWVLIEHSPDYLRRSGVEPAALVDLFIDAGFEPFEPAAGPLTAIPPDALRADAAQRNVLWRRKN